MDIRYTNSTISIEIFYEFRREHSKSCISFFRNTPTNVAIRTETAFQPCSISPLTKTSHTKNMQNTLGSTLMEQGRNMCVMTCLTAVTFLLLSLAVRCAGPCCSAGRLGLSVDWCCWKWTRFWRWSPSNFGFPPLLAPGSRSSTFS